MDKVYSLDMGLLLCAEEFFDEMNDYSSPEQEQRKIKDKYKRKTTVNVKGNEVPAMSWVPFSEWEAADRDKWNELAEAQKEYLHARDLFYIDYLYVEGSYEDAYRYAYNNDLLDILEECKYMPCGAGDRQCTFLCPHYKEGKTCNYDVPMRMPYEESIALEELLSQKE